MSLKSTYNDRPLRQIQSIAHELLEHGHPEEAVEVTLSALAALLSRNAELELLLKKLRRAQAGVSKSEKLDPRQLELLFAMLESMGDEEEPDIEAEAKADAELDREIEAAAQTRPDRHPDQIPAADSPKTRSRNKALASDLEERHTHLDVPDHQKEWEVVGETTSERLRYSAAHFYKEVFHQPIVRNPEPREDGSLGDEIVPAPATVVPDGMPGNDVVAMLLVRKYEEQTPLHRMHRQFLRDQNLDLPVSTMADWVAWGGRALQRLMPSLLERVTAAFLVQTDATGMRVLDSESPEGVHRGTFHAYMGSDGIGGRPADILFDYTPTGHAEDGPWRVLQGRTGYVLADASNSFDRLFNGKAASAVELGCHFHARRGFKALDDDPRAAYPLQLVRRLYRIETLADTRGLEAEARAKLRGERSAPILEKLKKYYLRLILDGTPDEPIRKAAQYCINHWDALTRFVDDGRLPLDNNAVERLFRGLRIGERNFLFAGSDAAAERMAAIYSILATAKAHGLNLMDYLVDILDRLSEPMTQANVATLLPHCWKPRSARKN